MKSVSAYGPFLVTEGSWPRLIDVSFNHLVALRDVTRKQSYPREAQELTSSSFQSVLTTSVGECVRDKRLLL